MSGRTSGEKPTFALIEDLILFLLIYVCSGKSLLQPLPFSVPHNEIHISSSRLPGSGSSTHEAPLPVLTPSKSSNRMPLTSPRASWDIRVPPSPHLRSSSASSPAGNLGRIWGRAKGCVFCLPAWGPLAFSPQGCFQHSWDLMQKPGEQKIFTLCCPWALKHCQDTVGPGLSSSFELEKTDSFVFLSSLPDQKRKPTPFLCSPHQEEIRGVWEIATKHCAPCSAHSL